MKNLMKIIKKLMLLIAILITLKITWLAGYLYLTTPVGLLLKILNVSDENTYEYLWQYLPEHFNLLNFSNNQITLISISSIDLILMQTIVISWLCYFFIKKRKNNYSFSPVKKKLQNMQILLNWGGLSLILCGFSYCLIDIFTLTYNNNEILELLQPTYFLKLIQILIGYNIIIHSIVVYLIFQYESWNFYFKCVISIFVLAFFIIYSLSLDNILIWKEGGISVLLNTKPIEEQSVYLTEAILETYNYYGLNISVCNPDSLNPCLEIKKQMEIACTTKETIDQLPLYGKNLRTNLAGYVPSFYADYRSGCSGMKKALQICMENYMQNNFIQNWNLHHQPIVQYYVPQKPVLIKLPKI